MGVMPWADNYGGSDRSKWAAIKDGLQCAKNWDSCRPKQSFLQ